jgi:hypothetical protein
MEKKTIKTRVSEFNWRWESPHDFDWQIKDIGKKIKAIAEKHGGW